MCYESLLNGDATERSLRDLLVDERSKAVENGIVAALLVVVVLSVAGSETVLTAGMALLAMVLGAALHQSLLVAAVLVIRAHGRFTRGRGQPTLPGVRRQ